MCVCSCAEIDPNFMICQEDSCDNGGTCNETTFSCICASDYGGSTCNITLCDDIMCLNGGTCAAGVCICAFGFTGDACETKATLCMEISCLNGGTCFEAGGQEVCSCLPKFTGKQCETELCLAENDIPVYPGSTITYSWPQTEAGKSERQVCPDICQDFIDYPLEAAVVRECLADTAEWQDTDITGCGFSVTALQLCEAKLVQMHEYREIINIDAFNVYRNSRGLINYLYTVDGISAYMRTLAFNWKSWLSG